MDQAAMQDRVANGLRNTSIATLITGWLNDSIVRIGTKYVFGYLHTNGASPSIVGNPDIVLPTNFLWLKTLECVVDNKKLYFKDEQRIAEMYPNYRTYQGVPSWYYLNGRNLGLHMVPGAIKTYDYSYQRRPLQLTSTLTDISDLPEEWHALIVQDAKTAGYEYENNTNMYTTSQQTAISMERQLAMTAYKRVDYVAQLSGPDVGSYRGRRPPRPRLGAHYPPTGA